MKRIVLFVLVCSIGLSASALAQHRERPRRAPRPSPSAPTTSSDAAPPMPITPPGRAIAIGVAGDHSCAVTIDQRAFCWGNDSILTLLAPRASILGPRPAPTALVRSLGATGILMVGSQPVVRIGDAQLVSYGTWDVQALGQTVHSPEQWQGDALVIDHVHPGTTIVPSADGAVVCAIEAGAMRCRGANQYGQLGAGRSEDASADFVSVVGLHGVTSASSGGSTTCAIDASGLSCWGRAFDGALGTGATEDARAPAHVAIEHPVEVAVSRRAHACARDAAGDVWCWGRGNEGQIGNAPTSRSTPARVAGVTGATAIAVGEHHSCAITGGGTVACWGAGNEGQLGNGATQGSVTPVMVTGLANVHAIALGDAHACALDLSGAVWCWGRNREGSCGSAAGPIVSTPVRVLGP